MAILNKTLIIRFSSIGDIVCSTLLVRTLRSQFPDCQLDYVLKDDYVDLLRHNPQVSNIIAFPRNGSFRDLRRLRQRIRGQKYDHIVDIHDSLRSRFLCFGAGNVVRVRKRKLARFLLVNFKLNVYKRFGGAPPVPLRYMEPVGKLGVGDDGKGLEMTPGEDAESRIVHLLEQSGFAGNQQFIGICPSARHNNKMWMKEGFAESAARLSERYLNPVVLFGSENERERNTDVEDRIREVYPQGKVLNLAGKISLSETAAMMDRCSVIITNDTGLMHIAAARKRSIVALFGPTVREFGFFPFGTNSVVVEHSGLECRPCTHIGLPACPLGHFKCMKEISVTTVVNAAETLLSKPA